VRREFLRSDVLQEIIGESVDVPTHVLSRAKVTEQPEVLLPLRLHRDGVRMNLFSTMTTLGTPLDITLQELRMESFFAADAASERILSDITSGRGMAT
jgi:hypothetical protein